MVLYLAIGAVLLAARSQPRYAGWRTYLFVVLWGWGTLLVEQFRSPDLLRAPPIIQPVALAVALGMTGFLIAVELSRWRRLAVASALAEPRPGEIR